MASVIVRMRWRSSSSFCLRNPKRATGSAIAARMAMIATTVINSATVKPRSLRILNMVTCLLNAALAAAHDDRDGTICCILESHFIERKGAHSSQRAAEMERQHFAAADEMERRRIVVLHGDRPGVLVDGDGRQI